MRISLLWLAFVAFTFTNCAEQVPTVSRELAPPVVTTDTVYLTDTVIEQNFVVVTDTLYIETTDTLYLRDTTDFKAVDLMTVGFDLVRRVLMDSTTNGSIKFVDVGYCDSPTQIHASFSCEFFKVYGQIYTKQGGNIPDGLKRFTAWIRYDGAGSTSDSANWDLFDMEWR